MAHNSIYQTDAINLTNSGRTKGVTSEALVEIEKYFKAVTIDEKTNCLGKKWLTFYVPFISLFTNSEYRNSYLVYTASSKKKSVIELRTILSDDKLRRKYYATIIYNVGSLCESENIPVFKTSTHSYTEKNARSGGKMHKYYLSIKGMPCKDEGYTDLTDMYAKIRELKENGEKVAASKVCANKKAE